MTPATLQALRRLLFYSIPEAAEHVGHRSERAWRMWERGELPVPADVAQRMRAMVAWRQVLIRRGRTDRDFVDAAALAMSAAFRRPHQSVIAELLADGTISDS